ncbi:uncharacterized protein Dana_GF11954 [Drosophila ananassae]|uniref:Uncharacterized protein n=1 Tax=Drosophila ananassae TaxID=7217 RepID=B3MDP9_DROAN|nr:uncharacterized protein LOC6494813 isoform X1 [Drosophila ananassae]EDV36434.2 uncharacterized protein Dana_GF11954 [Drosophila ananassae]
MHKTWNKPFHKRKVWRTVSRPGKLVYYMQPLVDHFFEIWMQPLPFPTLLKFAYSCGLVFFILLPILYPLLVLLLYYGIFQYVGERHTGVAMPENWDLLGAAANLWHFEITNKKYQLGLHAHGPLFRVQLSPGHIHHIHDIYLPLWVNGW